MKLTEGILKMGCTATYLWNRDTAQFLYAPRSDFALTCQREQIARGTFKTYMKSE